MSNNDILNSNNDEKIKETLEGKEKINSIKELGNTINNNPNKSIQVLSIIGQIEGHSVLPPQTKATRYEHIIPQLIDIEQNDAVKGLLIVLNTVGGDVEAGLAIAEMIRSMSKPTVSIVIGGGHSIGVPLATSSDYSFITPSATSNINMDVLEKFMDQRDDLLNDVGTMLIGKQAVECGLIDEVGGISEALYKLKNLIGEKKSK